MTEISFYQQVYPIIVMMPIAAACFLALVLSKGEVCPGQCKRITENMISIWAVLALGLMIGIEVYATTATLVIGGVAVFIGIIQNLIQSRLEGKRAIPSTWLRLPIALAVITGLLVLWQQQQPLLLLESVLLGAVFAHVILLRAKHRLQAFNVILPVVGIASSVLLMLGLLVVASMHAEPSNISVIQEFVIYRAIILLLALGVWTIPLYTKQEYTPNIVSLTTVLLLFSEVMSMGIIAEF
ncbi:hypothetical protein [Moritella sp. F3]|uniref:hypothetical protein n=1 Tax=Moritella sp. F3 TaxID=2718882 RepID=UPI0018E13789|nr:hypothetical protein [Moritella sp. F3]GIC78444.1 hypothetical protein FMO001_31710 [Moritella sp. F1]GIC84144.1 hypothetical protein FMO003_44240 [Moritella sp. F3]